MSLHNRNFMIMNEYSNLGKNINEINREEYSINDTSKTLKNICENGNSEELKKFISKLRSKRIKSNLENSNFANEFDGFVNTWNQSSSSRGGICVPMLEPFINELKDKDEFIKAFMFEDENKIKLWVIVEDSVSDECDEIYNSFLNTYDDDKYSIMIFDKEVAESVENQVNNIIAKYEVILKYGC